MPFIAFFWALSLALFYNTLFRDVFTDHTSINKRNIVLFTVLGFCILFLLIPVRSLINRYIKEPFDGAGAKWYDELISKFSTDYDRENPITKTDGIKKYLIKLMEEEQDEENRKKYEELRKSGKDIDYRQLSNQVKKTKFEAIEAEKRQAKGNVSVIIQKPAASFAEPDKSNQ